MNPCPQASQRRRDPGRLRGRSRRSAGLALAFALAATSPGGVAGAEPSALRLASDDVAASRPIAETFVYGGNGCHGKNLSPELHWSGVPSGTREFAVTMVDPDAPMSRPFVHWTAYHIGKNVRSLKRGTLPPGAAAGVTDWGDSAYGGPCPPAGQTHRYIVRLDALAAVLPLTAQTTEGAYEKLRTGHVLATATITSRYGR